MASTGAAGAGPDLILLKQEPDLAPPTGFNNTGSICYLNSLLQGLLACTAFVESVRQGRLRLVRTRTGEALTRLVQSPSPDRSAEVLRALMLDLAQRRPQTKFGNSQECASEALTLLLEMAEEENAEVATLTRRFLHSHQINPICTVCGKTSTADAQSDRNIQFMVNAPMAGWDHGAKASEGLRRRSSRLSEYECPCCSKTTAGVRFEQLSIAPEVLVLVFNQYGMKQVFPHPITEPIELPAKSGQACRYRLVAQLEHFGTASSGHYSARVLRQGRVWTCNDSNVSEAGAFRTSPNVYMAFYHLQEVV